MMLTQDEKLVICETIFEPSPLYRGWNPCFNNIHSSSGKHIMQRLTTFDMETAEFEELMLIMGIQKCTEYDDKYRIRLTKEYSYLWKNERLTKDYSYLWKNER
jgi:hypothetical protein